MAYPNYIWVKVKVPVKARLDELVIDNLVNDLMKEAKNAAIDRIFNVDENLEITLNKNGDEQYHDYGPNKGLVPLMHGKIEVMTMTHETPFDFICRIEDIAEHYNCRAYENDVAENDCDSYWVDDGFPPCR